MASVGHDLTRSGLRQIFGGRGWSRGEDDVTCQLEQLSNVVV